MADGNVVMTSVKLASGEIYMIGGATAGDFEMNLAALFGDEDSKAVIEKMRTAIVEGVLPPMPVGMQQAVATLGNAFPQAAAAAPQAYPPASNDWAGTQAAPRQPAGPPPGNGLPQPPLCSMHGQPMGWQAPGISQKTGQPYTGFWKCAYNDRSCKAPR